VRTTIELFLIVLILMVLLVGVMLWLFFLRERQPQRSWRRAGTLREEIEGTGGERIYPPIHPGELLREEFLEPMEITPDELAESIGAPVRDIRKLVREEERIESDLSRRLDRYFGMSEGFWMKVQGRYEREVEEDLGEQ
jgi:addiction module HigA family antidote